MINHSRFVQPEFLFLLEDSIIRKPPLNAFLWTYIPR